MDSALIAKIAKAKQYAEEKERVRFMRFTANFRGNHNEYTVEYDGGRWNCTCAFFSSRGICSHTMALERILDGMIEGSLAPKEHSG